MPLEVSIVSHDGTPVDRMYRDDRGRFSRG
jgi:hypothetical protein